MLLEPSLPLVEGDVLHPGHAIDGLLQRNRSPPTPLFARSRRCSELETTTCGGAKSGNCAIGSVGMAIAPPSTIRIAQTVAKHRPPDKEIDKTSAFPSFTTRGDRQPHFAETGQAVILNPRLLRVRDLIFLGTLFLPGLGCVLRLGPRRLHCSLTGAPSCRKLRSGNDQVVAGFQAVEHGVVVAEDFSHLTTRCRANVPFGSFSATNTKKLSIDSRHGQHR